MNCPVCGRDTPPGTPCPSCAAGVTPQGPIDDSSDLGNSLYFHGTASELFPLFVRCLLLSLVTFGLYSFWARAELRRYFLSRLEMEGDRFAYHGTGREGFFGFLRIAPLAILLLGGPLALFLFGGDGGRATLGLALFYVAVLASIPAAIALSWRYRVSRTSWRGVRLSWRGSVAGFYGEAAKGFFVTILTLGICFPLLQARIRRALIGQTWFGNRPFSYHENGEALVGPRFVAMLLTYFTIGINWFWYWARERRHIMGAIEFSGHRLWTNITGGELFNLHVPNGIFLLLTLGLGWPLTAVRNWRFMATNFIYDRETDLNGIVQEARSASAAGDILEGMMDTDVAGLDFGL